MNLEIAIQKEGTSIGDYVYQVLRKNIINLNMPPGKQISEKEVSILLNVSRTPVREAFIKLSREGLLYVLPQRGTYISYIDLETVEDTRFIRESLEKPVLKIATKSFPDQLLDVLQDIINQQKKLIKKRLYSEFLELDEEFHKTIFEGCDKSSVWDFIEQINSEYKRARILTFIADISWVEVIEQHEQLLESIKNHDEQMAQDVISIHVQKLIFEQIELKEKYPHYFED